MKEVIYTEKSQKRLQTRDLRWKGQYIRDRIARKAKYKYIYVCTSI